MTLQIERLRTIEQLKAFIAGSAPVDCKPLNRESAYDFVRRTLVAFDYHRLAKADRGCVRRYVVKVTALSPAQLTRLVARHAETGAVVDRRARNSGRPFEKRYRPTDIRRLAEVDEAFGQMSGLATCEILRRAFEMHAWLRRARVAGGDGRALDRPVAGKVLACNDLLERVVDQTRRRVFGGETVPAREKVVSLFEPHTDIIVKGGRGTHHGHKVNFATGRSGLALDAVVEDGNPADSARCLPMLARPVEHYGAAPTHAAFDGGYASRENLKAAKMLGVTHAVFHKKLGMKVADMTSSAWLYRQLKRFRAGVEAGISYLKRCFGLGLCRWRGLPRFKAYVQSAVFAHNLMRLARLRPQPG